MGVWDLLIVENFTLGQHIDLFRILLETNEDK